MTSGGTIPDSGDYSVLLEPQGLPIGTLNEDFAIESMASVEPIADKSALIKQKNNSLFYI